MVTLALTEFVLLAPHRASSFQVHCQALFWEGGLHICCFGDVCLLHSIYFTHSRAREVLGLFNVG